MKKLTLNIIALLLLSTVFVSCDWLKKQDWQYSLGWLSATEDTAHTPDAVNLSSTFSNTNLPASVDLSPYFPTIGDQGQYGTCVAWAVGYNEKSFLDAYDRGETYYTSTSKIMSPKDLFWAIDNSNKGSNCNGTNFNYAFEILVNRGVATLSTVPYTSLGDCSSTPPSSWTSDAGNNKIDNYREITVDKNTIKSYLANNQAVVFGADVGDEFMNYNGGVLDYQSSGNRGGHAMILCGYDDSKGTNGAFKVVNSWGTSWGENGYAWVDQDYFCTSDFCFCAYVASNTPNNPDPNGDDVVDNTTSGDDLIAWNLDDQDDLAETDPTWRASIYNVFNAGNNTIPANKDWSIVYLLYDAYNGNSYQILLFDYYTDNYGNPGENQELTDPTVTGQIPARGYWWNYIDVPAGWSVAHAVYNSSESDNFTWSYQMPNVTGYYYLIIYADAFDTFNESDESNNFTYFTADNGNPLYIENGVITNAPAKKLTLNYIAPTMNQSSPMETVRFGKNKNFYSTFEIAAKLHDDAKTGVLKNKVLDFARTNSTKAKRLYNSK